MSIVGRGLPDGPIVTGGLGSTAPAAPGEMSALLVGSGSVTATLSADTGAPPETPGGGWGWTPHHLALLKQQQEQPAPQPISVALSAVLIGYGDAVTATATTTERQPDDWADQIAVLLTLELV
jgi:hypothetical protein